MCQLGKCSDPSIDSRTDKKGRPIDQAVPKTRRGKRDQNDVWLRQQKPLAGGITGRTGGTKKKKVKKESAALRKHGKDSPSGGIEAMLPSLIGVGILVFAVMAQQGFRGRASVAGIDLGTTNSVICVQAPSKGVGEIDCISDPESGSAIIPSVVSFLEPHERKIGPYSKIASSLVPHPSHVVVGSRAKHRIDSHPTHTLYHAKRVLGRPADDPAIAELNQEVEYKMIQGTIEDEGVMFQVNGHIISPRQVGSYVVFHLLQIAKTFLGHDNIKSAVLAVPAKFDTRQRQLTMEAFQQAGVKISRVLEEPSAAALAYGLHKKEGVEKILVYDFGGGTLDVSILHISEGYVEVMGSDGDDRLGGANFDGAVANLLLRQHQQILSDIDAAGVNVEELSLSCPQVSNDVPLCTISSFHTLGERMKIALSGMERVKSSCLSLPSMKQPHGESRDFSCEDLVKQDLELSLDDYNAAVKPLFDRSLIPITRLMDDLTLEADDIQEIVMVGGTTRMPQIRKLVSEAFGSAQLNTHIDPDITVAYGAASVVD
ncbi:unnamed protein product [Cylindrotheca closterium]|uniref:Uncharacterized protein n=1 Tax=Cylindrotheca closterium TaxID=2856 RepID=A0AAD2FKK9_9STRA|nr:unnamed protein product [Cylindrotheca closterium]